MEISIPYALARRSLRGMQEVHSRFAEADVRKRQAHEKKVVIRGNRIIKFDIKAL